MYRQTIEIESNFEKLDSSPETQEKSRERNTEEKKQERDFNFQRDNNTYLALPLKGHPLQIVMFEITSIEYKGHDVIVNINTGESIRFPYDISTLYKLERGKVIDHTEYQQLKDESNRYECNKKALSFLSIRNRSYREIENYLFKKGFSKDIIKSVLNKLRENGYIDDLDFAKKFINYKRKELTCL